MDNTRNLSDDELLEKIGASLPPDEMGMFPKVPDPKELRDRALEWLRANHAQLQNKVCNSKAITRLDESKEADLVFHATCEVLAGYLTGLHVGAVAAYILRQGLDRFCQSQSR